MYKLHICIPKSKNYFKRNFPSRFLPERLLCGGSATRGRVFCEPVLPSVKERDLSRAVVFIAHPCPAPPPSKLYPWALLLWKWECGGFGEKGHSDFTRLLTHRSASTEVVVLLSHVFFL